MINGKGFAWGSPFVTKAILVGVLGWLCTISLIMYEARYMFTQLSYIALFLSFVFQAISLKCSMDTQIVRKTFWQKAHHWLFEVIFVLNMLVPAVYFTVLVGPIVASCENSIQVIHTYAIHTIPTIASILTLAVTDIVVKARHTMALTSIGILYSIYNWYVVKRTGEPVYWFLDWKDSTTPMILAGLNLSSSLFFLGLSYATQYVRALRHSKKAKSC